MTEPDNRRCGHRSPSERIDLGDDQQAWRADLLSIARQRIAARQS
jgi:hypothetical protein